MGIWSEVKAQTRGSKLLFNVLFHGFHFGLFALGWCVYSLEDVYLQKLIDMTGNHKKTIKGWRA